MLARFGLTGDLVFHTVGQLSGGEKAKAALARLCATSANLLVMDEPTNHLDIWSREALERSINEFEGTVLVVSHDRYFLNQVADRLVVIAAESRVIEGDYETYQHLVQKEKDRDRKSAAPAAATGTAHARRARRPRRPSENSPIARPSTSSARSASSKARSPSSKTSSASPPPARSRQGRRHPGPPHRIESRLETLYQHWETALEANW